MVEGKHLNLRLVEESDAEFILNLRIDDSLGKFLSKTDISLDKQKEWIKNYKSREKEKKEYYFIIKKNNSNENIGVVRIYNFIKNSFEWGSWIIKKGAPNYSALESALLVYEYGFYNLKFDKSHFEVRKDNVKVISFHEKFGAKRIKETEHDIFYNYNRESYEEFREKYKIKYLNQLKG